MRDYMAIVKGNWKSEHNQVKDRVEEHIKAVDALQDHIRNEKDPEKRDL